MHDSNLTNKISRRTICLATMTLPWLAGCATGTTSDQKSAMKVGALFAGKVNDRGFMEAGWRGLERARVQLGVQTDYIDGIQPQREALVAALTKLAERGAQLVVAHGGQNNEACDEVAKKFPNTRFVVTQGAVTGNNLSSYDVLQEESAYLAGVLAALTTRTGVVGHMSGIRVRPGLKGRAAYAAGVKDTDSSIRLLTNFSGNQDDNDLSYRVASAQIKAGADVIFTMLNAGRDGVTRACRELRSRQIGNVIDWTASDPNVFVGSAMADVGIGVYEAAKDMKNLDSPKPGIQKVGLSNPDAVRLSVAADVSPAVRSKIELARTAIIDGRIKMTEDFNGPEFTV